MHLHYKPGIPESLEVQRFGDYISGLADGEGCFHLSVDKKRLSRGMGAGQAGFSIILRADDCSILSQIKSFLGCGVLGFDDGKNEEKRGGTKLRARFYVYSIPPLQEIIVPFLNRIRYEQRSLEILLYGNKELISCIVYGADQEGGG